MTITENIDNLLKERKLSRRKLAKKAGIPPSTLQSAMETGKINNIETLRKIAAALGLGLNVTPDGEPYFFAFESPVPSETSDKDKEFNRWQLANAKKESAKRHGQLPANTEPPAAENDQAEKDANVTDDDAAEARARVAHVQRLDKEIEELWETDGESGFDSFTQLAFKMAMREYLQPQYDEAKAYLDKLNEKGLQVAAERIAELAEIPRYQKAPADDLDSNKTEDDKQPSTDAPTAGETDELNNETLSRQDAPNIDATGQKEDGT